MAKVEIYTRRFCGYCVAAKRLLEGKQVDYVEHDVTGDSDMAREMMSKSGGRATYPQIFIATHHIGGCDDLYEIERSGRLDALLAV
jgi:glutaredoxin 3